ncbi:MAG TPA: DNA-binding protein [Bacillales bacterium]|nr:DNA-binding protein [Bacillales bacterium]
MRVNENNTEKVMLGIPDIMRIMGIGRINAEEIMKLNNFPTKQVGRRILVHRDIFEAWLKGETEGYE